MARLYAKVRSYPFHFRAGDTDTYQVFSSAVDQELRARLKGMLTLSDRLSREPDQDFLRRYLISSESL
jgi:hypothetical protein